MTTIHSGRPSRDAMLRLTLRLDAVASGAMGLVFAVAAPALDGALGVPMGWLVGLGAFLVAYGGGLTWLAAQPRIPAALAWTVIVGNLGWVLASVAAVAADWFAFTTLGAAVAIAQAVAVVVFAEAQFMGLRRARPAAPAVAR
jgi:hypothetical protein